MITQKYINELSYKIIGCAIEVHKYLGPGLLESVYETCHIDELIRKNLNVKKHVQVPFITRIKNWDAVSFLIYWLKI